MSNHLGILGHSAEGAALCFRVFCQLGEGELGEHEHPDVSLDCRSFAPCMPAYDRGDFDWIRAFMEVGLNRLAKAGADFFVCPDNTVHQALERPGRDFPLPGLHIADVVADHAARDGRSRVGVLGTGYLMGGPVYPAALERRGIAAELPDAEDRELVNDIIFRELVKGVFTDESRDRFRRVIERLGDRGCDAVALVCTEIPLLVTPESSPLPTLDSTRLGCSRERRWTSPSAGCPCRPGAAAPVVSASPSDFCPVASPSADDDGADHPGRGEQADRGEDGDGDPRTDQPAAYRDAIAHAQHAEPGPQEPFGQEPGFVEEQILEI